MVLGLLALACTLTCACAWAEKADSDRPTQIDAQRGQYNDLKQTGWYEGNVVLVKGTLRIEGGRMDFRKDPQGYEHAIIVGDRSTPATFRQRRDSTQPGIEEYVEGRAARIEYDGRAETMKLIGQATWRRLENEQLRDEIHGNQILYDSRHATYEASGDGKDLQGRVRTVIAPRREAAAQPAPANSAPGATAPSLTPATTLKTSKP